ncbi:peptide chain release factor H [Flocculibacter collagenilyticus]|uniref:peptide chain release factor H n=1 Tax=Flocculibacter collagenilyticus TaxID=2744479 RepID=UPI0018F41CDD|nr:peptide chain release factor H [Flocculibacter collagenilyticus]
MILLQLSAGQGPVECGNAVGLALKAIEKQCKAQGIKLETIEAIEMSTPACFKSVLMQLDSGKTPDAKRLAASWQGTMLWVCQSQFRSKHKRKNWFFSGHMYEINDIQFDRSITFQTCRASGAGGQHVNKTDSAVRAVHTETGVAVRVESERSQHANKRLARALLFQKLEATKHAQLSLQEKARWQQHWELERGNPVKTFKDEKFALVD